MTYSIGKEGCGKNEPGGSPVAFCFVGGLSQERELREKRHLPAGGEIVPAFHSSSFSQAFSRLLQKTGISCYQICQYSHLDQAYLSRLKRGERCSPSQETVLKICLALAHFSDKLNLSDVEELFNSAGLSLFERNSSHDIGVKLTQNVAIELTEPDLE